MSLLLNVIPISETIPQTLFCTLREKCPNTVFSGPYLCIQSECGKITTRKTPYLDTFYTMVGWRYQYCLGFHPVPNANFCGFWKCNWCNSMDSYFRLYVLVMSRTFFRVNPHSIVAWMSRNTLLEAGAKPEV